ncbi:MULTISPECIES: hypothetical protein [Pseudanabaena]|uniref:Uncharacterized protein n=1 Tax=Pseudanabaena catenata USMAC16 TaxID=1855837 RepID=A0A9X4RKT1_9CYAN|nr:MULTISPECIES: hypothetical protein [Pseudanabaena]MDG3494189.1 hypothetical protein [Pseudanabaena catenata USMAC16]
MTDDASRRQSILGVYVLVQATVIFGDRNANFDSYQSSKWLRHFELWYESYFKAATNHP